MEVMNEGTGQIGRYYEVNDSPFPYRVRIRGGGIDEYESIETLKEYWKEIE